MARFAQVAIAVSSLAFCATGARAAAPTWPVKLGHCGTSKLESISGRITDEPSDSGFTWRFANGNQAVSFDTMSAAEKSFHKGDDVKMCVTKVPSHCPVDDWRGWEYKMTDLRSHRSVQEINAGHLCGGA